MQAIILAGGAGTRLQGVVRDVPKPMADINGKPFICYLLDYLAAYDVKRFCFLWDTDMRLSETILVLNIKTWI